MENINTSFINLSVNNSNSRASSVTKGPESKINDDLKTLSTKIIPTDEFTKKGNKTLQKILDLLKRKSRFDIGRHVIVGSNGKKTAIIHPDVDCVVFINYEEPMFVQILDDFEDILMMAEASYKIQGLRKAKFSIQFNSNGFDFDILPAPNFVVRSKFSGDNLVKEQQQLTLERIKQNPSKRYVYSSGVSEAAVLFVKRQGSFVNEMIRICKFWYKTLLMGKYISGAKSLIELVAIHAAINDESFNEKSYLRCFSKFLELLIKFDHLNISFDPVPNHPAPSYIKNQRPLVLEPANPYNNLAKYWEKDSVDRLKGYATQTIARIGKMYEIASSTGSVMPMQLLFEIQPKLAPFHVSELRDGAEYIAGTSTDVKKFPDMIVRNESVMKIPGVYEDALLCGDYLKYQLKVCSYGAKRNPSPEDLQKQAQVCIDENVVGCPSDWVSAKYGHENYDVTYVIPAGPYLIKRQ